MGSTAIGGVNHIHSSMFINKHTICSYPIHHIFYNKEEYLTILMEACFLSSNCFAKSMQLIIPPIRGRISHLTRWKNCNKYHTRKFVACCLSGPEPSSPQDEEWPYLRADWRAFRARLVAKEQTSPLHEPNSQQRLPLTIGDKWAHIIHEPEKGCLLIASEKLDGVHIFERTVILLLTTGPIGPTGLILNRPSLMSIKEMRSSSLDVTGAFSDSPLYFGGPLQDTLFLVSSPKQGNDVVETSGMFDEVLKGLYYGTKESVGCAAEMVKRDVVEVGDFRFFDGYCAWEREQLRDEIRAGYWTVAACSPSVVGLSGGSGIGLWEEIVGLVGPRKVW